MKWLRSKRAWVVGSAVFLFAVLTVWFMVGRAKPRVSLLHVQQVNGVQVVEMRVSYEGLGSVVYSPYVKVRTRVKPPEEIKAKWKGTGQIVQIRQVTPPPNFTFQLPPGQKVEEFEVGVTYVEYPLLSSYLPSSWSPSRAKANTVWSKTIRP